MVYEYALDPELIIKWSCSSRDYSEFISAFGLGTTRIPSVVQDFHKWQKTIIKRLYELKLEGTEEEKRIESFLKVISETYIKRPGAQHNGNWYEKVIKEHHRFPFDYIFVEDKSKCDTTKTIVQDDIYLDIKRKKIAKKWDHPTQDLVECTTKKMSQVVQNMLGLASHIILIDPYLGLIKDKKQQNLNIIIEFIKASLSNNIVELPVKFEIIYSSVRYKNEEDIPTYRMHPNKKQKQKGVKAEDLFYKPEDLYIELNNSHDYLSESIDLSIKDIYEKWKGLKIHNRYILTDIGGVMLGKGIEPSYSNHKDEFILLNKEIYDQKWKDYIKSMNPGGMTPRFGIIDSYPPEQK